VANSLQPYHVRKPCNGTDRPACASSKINPKDQAVRLSSSSPPTASLSGCYKPGQEYCHQAMKTSHELESLNHRGRRVATRADAYPKENHSPSFCLGYHYHSSCQEGDWHKLYLYIDEIYSSWRCDALSEYPPKNDRAASDSRKGKARGSHSSPRAISGSRMPPSAGNYSFS
jgi:hypothetical protein